MAVPRINSSGIVERSEVRHKVLLQVRMRVGGAFVNICLRDISSRGMLAQAESPPVRGTFVEIVHCHRSVVGQVRWASGRRFGIALRDRIVVEAFLQEPRSAKPGPAVVAREPRLARADVRASHARSIAISARMQFVLIAGGAVMLGGFLANSSYAYLVEAMREVEQGLRAD